MVTPDMAPTQETSQIPPRRPRVLAVDDQPDTLRVIQLRLQNAGMDCTACSNGAEALNFLKQEFVDVVILDVRMPDMDGYQVCRRLKADPRTKDVPVLFLTANHQTEDKMLGFQAGAHDYLTKPASQLELQARVSAALRVKQLQDQLKLRLQQQEQHFQQQIQMQQKVGQLRQAMMTGHWQKLFSQLAASIAHEINNPLAAALVGLDLAANATGLPGDAHARLNVANTSLRRAGDKLRQLLFIARPGQYEESIQLDNLLNDVAALANFQHLKQKVALALQLEGGCPWHGRTGELGRAVLYLLNNAIEAATGQANAKVSLSLVRKGAHYRISVTDNGPGLGTGVRERLFEPFFTTKGPPHTGAGLHLAGNIVKAAGGALRYEAPDASGTTTFFIELPC